MTSMTPVSTSGTAIDDQYAGDLTGLGMASYLKGRKSHDETQSFGPALAIALNQAACGADNSTTSGTPPVQPTEISLSRQTI